MARNERTDRKNTEHKNLDRIEGYILPVLTENHYELYDLEFVKEGANWYLRILIDKEGGITIEDCELVSRKAEAILDEKDPIEQSYILEISSPGIDRPLKKDAHFEKYKGELVDVKLYKPHDGKKEYQGELVGLVGGCIVIRRQEQEWAFERASVAQCRLAVVF